jgi:hypothetical protein
MIQIPDLKKMLVTVRVPEAFVAHLHNPKQGDPSTRQKAEIKVDSFSRTSLEGYVRSVDTVASAQDFFASDVKVYKTKVMIEGEQKDLKPGMSAEVTIYADESNEPVLVVPVQAVLGTISSGAERKCFVLNSHGQPELRTIKVGMSNERVVEVKEGLKENEQVVLNPTPLLKEDSELKPGKARGGKGEGDKSGSDGAPGEGPKGGKGKGPKGPGGSGGPGGARGGAPGDGGKKFGGSPPGGV